MPTGSSSVEVIDAIVAIPSTLAQILAKIPEADKRPWFPQLARDTQMAVMGGSFDLESADDVRAAVCSYVVAVAERAQVGRLLLPLTQDQWRSEQWAAHGIHARSILGSPELWWNNLLLRALSGERRYKLVLEFQTHKDASRLAHAVVRDGVRDPLDPRRRYWEAESEVAALPNSLVSTAAMVILALSSPALPDAWLQRGATNDTDIGFLLRRTGQVPRGSEDGELKSAVASEWLHEERQYWSNLLPADQGDSLFNIIGTAIRRAYDRAARGYTRGRRQYESASDRLEFHWIRRSGLYSQVSERIDDVDARGVDSTESGEIDDALLAVGRHEPAESRASIPEIGHWLDGRELRCEFAESVQVERDIDLAFRATGADRVLNGRDRQVFKVYLLSGASWEAVEGAGGITEKEVIAAKRKLLPGRNPAVCAWLSAVQDWLKRRYSYRRVRLTPARILARCLAKRKKGAGRLATALMEGGAVTGEELLHRIIARLQKPPVATKKSTPHRPAFLDGVKLPSVHISHDWGAETPHKKQGQDALMA